MYSVRVAGWLRSFDNLQEVVKVFEKEPSESEIVELVDWMMHEDRHPIERIREIYIITVDKFEFGDIVYKYREGGG